MTKSKDISKTKNKNLTLSDTEQNTILAATIDGELSIDVARNLRINLMTFYKYLEQNPKFKAEYEKAQEIGIKTLVEKMLKIFDTDPASIEPNELLFLREKKDNFQIFYSVIHVKNYLIFLNSFCKLIFIIRWYISYIT